MQAAIIYCSLVVISIAVLCTIIQYTTWKGFKEYYYDRLEQANVPASDLTCVICLAIIVFVPIFSVSLIVNYVLQRRAKYE